MGDWISVENSLPECHKPSPGYCMMSDKVLVKSEKFHEGKAIHRYPWVSHLHKQKQPYSNYAACWTFEIDGYSYVWLCPHMDISVSKRITHWKQLPL